MADRSKFLDENGNLDAEKLFTSYSELETKLGTTNTPPKPTPKSLTRNDLIPFFQEAARSEGKLSDASYQNLQDTYGLDRSVVDEFAEGQTAKAQVYRSTIEGIVGGKEQLDGLVEWAKVNLPDAEKQVFANQVDGGSIAEATAALNGLVARRAQAGNAPAGNQVQGAPVSQGAVAGFSNMDELSEAVGDEKYGKDVEYTNLVNARAEKTGNDVVDARSLTPSQ